MKTALRLTLSLGIAATLLALLMIWGEVSPREALAAVLEVSPAVYLTALSMHLTVYCLRAARFRLLIPAGMRPSFKRTLVISAAHNLASYVLPAKTGEASLLVYLKQRCGVGGTRGLACLLVSRLLDATVLLSMLAVACSWMALRGEEPTMARLAPPLVAGALVLALLSVRGDLLVAGIARFLAALGLRRWNLGERLLVRVRSIAEAVREASGGGRLLSAALLSVPIWLGVFGFYAILSRDMGLPERIGFPQAIFGAGLAVTFNLLPVNGMAGFGTQEAGWVLGFGALAIPSDLALSTGIGVHLIQLFNVCALGLLAHLAMGIMAPLPRDPAQGEPSR